MVAFRNRPLGHSERAKPSLQDKNFRLGNSAAAIEFLKQTDFCSTFWNKMMLDKNKVKIRICVTKQRDILLAFENATVKYELERMINEAN